MEQTLEFMSEGRTLSGVLNLPEAEGRPKIGVIFANAGARGRLGNTFQYPYYADALAAHGWASLRFDPHGVGDSEGRIEAHETLAFLRTLQDGRFVDDLVAAIQLFKERVNPERIILWGVCGGAITSLIAAGRSDLVDGAVLLALPVFRDKVGDSPQTDAIPAGYAWDYLVTAYSKKMLDPKNWLRLLRGESELDTIRDYSLAVIKGQLGRVREPLSKLKHRLRGSPPPPKEVLHPAVAHPRLNPQVLPSLDALTARRVPLLVVFGEQDALRWHWEDHVKKPYWADNPGYAELFEEHQLPDCNHLFTLRRWQTQTLDLAQPWLRRHFG